MSDFEFKDEEYADPIGNEVYKFDITSHNEVIVSWVNKDTHEIIKSAFSEKEAGTMNPYCG